MTLPSDAKKVTLLIRLSLLLLVLPIFYIGIWISVTTDDSLTYFGQVQLFMSYFPEPVRNPLWTTLVFFGMSLASAVFSFYGYLKSSGRKAQIITIAICCIATLLTIWFGFTLL